MTNRTRYFMLGSTIIVALGIGTGLVAFYNGELPLLNSRTGPEELAYVPSSATGLAYANVQQIMNSEFRQRVKQLLPTGEAKDELFNETGIDIEHDIDTVVAAFVGAEPNQPPGFVIVRGRFDEGRIETLVRQHEGTVADYKGHRLILMGGGTSGEPLHGVAFLKTGMAVLGTETAVKQAIDTAESHDDITRNAELMKHVAELEGNQSSAWAVGNFAALQTNMSVPEQIKANLPPMQWIAVSARVDGGLSGRLLAEAQDDKAAADLRAVINGGIAAARLVGGKDVKLDALINSLQMGGSGKTVELGFTVSPEMVDVITGLGAAAQKPAVDAGKK